MTRSDAQALAAQGWPVFPTRAKVPLTPNGFRDASTNVPQDWPEDAQTAIAIPPGTLVVDVDDAAGLQALEVKHGPLPPTLTATSGKRGEHRYYRSNGSPLVQRKLGPGVDTRIGGKGYVVAPPSIHHETGRPYVWQEPRLPVADAPAWLLDALTPAPERVRTDADRSAQHVQAARTYLESVPPALEGKDSDGKGTTGGTHTFATCVRIVRGFALSENAALAALEDWNARCDPPWPESQLRRKVHEAAEKGDLPWGSLVPPEGLLEALRPAVTSTGPLDAAGIFTPLPPVDYLVNGIGITRGPPAMVAGYGYSGKTAAVQQMALDLARADHAGDWMNKRPVWGKFAAGRRAKVLHVDYEQGSHLTRRRYQRIALAAGVDPRELQGWLSLWSHPGWYTDTPQGYAALERAAEGYDLVIIDSYRAANPHTDENSSEARQPLDMLNLLSDKHGWAGLVIHHARKPNPDRDGGAKMAIRGSGALFDAPGSVLLFDGEKGEPKRVRHEKEKHTGHTEDDFALVIEDTDGGGLRVRVAEGVIKTNEEKAKDMLQVDIGKVREYLTKRVYFTNRAELRAVLAPAGNDRAGLVLGAMLASGEIVNTGTYNRPHYQLSGAK